MRRPARKDRRGARGLTLIEVLLAAVILGTSLVALLVAASRCLAVMKVATNYQKAQWTMNKGDLEHPLQPTNDVKALAVSPVDYDGLTYQRIVEDDDDDDNLFVVRTRVSWPDREREVMEETVRLILQIEDANSPKNKQK